MPDKKNSVHPYIPNSAPAVKEEMLKELGIKDIEELYREIPDHLRFKGKLNIPPSFPSEYELTRHVEDILKKNQTCLDNLNFLGGGCWQHYVPAVCDEINHRSEFLTAYAGEAYEDHGRFQSLFEYQSLMGELLDMDVVNVPTYDWCQSAATTIRMACRITKRSKVLVSSFISPERMSAIKNYCHPVVKIETIEHDPKSGLLDLDHLDSILKKENDIAGVYFENPNYFGIIETRGEKISSLIHTKGGLSLAGVDPISLGILKPPVQYGADIVCGDIQPLGMHMNYGGGQGGFIATRDEEKFVMEFPSRLFGITKTEVEGEYGFGDVAYERTSFDKREGGKEFVGTHSALWGITAGVLSGILFPFFIPMVNARRHPFTLQLDQKEDTFTVKGKYPVIGVEPNIFTGIHVLQEIKQFLVISVWGKYQKNHSLAGLAFHCRNKQELEFFRGNPQLVQFLAHKLEGWLKAARSTSRKHYPPL